MPEGGALCPAENHQSHHSLASCHPQCLAIPCTLPTLGHSPTFAPAVPLAWKALPRHSILFLSSTSLSSRSSPFSAQPHYAGSSTLTGVWPWTRSFSSLKLIFFIRKMGSRTEPSCPGRGVVHGNLLTWHRQSMSHPVRVSHPGPPSLPLSKIGTLAGTPCSLLSTSAPHALGLPCSGGGGSPTLTGLLLPSNHGLAMLERRLKVDSGVGNGFGDLPPIPLFHLIPS